jgi:DNA-binding winged helix-turn-helix (wHTH) protein
MNDKQELELLHEISKSGATEPLIAVLRIRLERKLAALREQELMDWLERSNYECDRLRAQISLLRSMLFDFELFGDFPTRTVVDRTTNTLTFVPAEAYQPNGS